MSKSAQSSAEGVSYLLLRPAEHTDGTDVIRVLSQTPLSFDSLGYSLRDIYRLQEVRERKRRRGEEKDFLKAKINFPLNSVCTIHLHSLPASQGPETRCH